MKILVVIDMQNDFIDGALGSADAVSIVDGVASRVASFDGKIIFTRDTHTPDYMNTQEGRKLPAVSARIVIIRHLPQCALAR